MEFKSPEMQVQLVKSSIVLQLLVYDAESFITTHFKKQAIVTRVWDSFPGESGVHPDKRAIDLRDEHEGERLFTDLEINSIINYLNGKWQRNDGKPTALHHSFQGGPLHLHLQIPISTKAYEIS